MVITIQNLTLAHHRGYPDQGHPRLHIHDQSHHNHPTILTITNLQLDLLFFVELSPSAKLAVKQLVLVKIFMKIKYDVIR